MTKHILPIKATYVSDWGLYEALRELIQNAKDEEEQHGHPMKVRHSGGQLHVTNEGADLSVTALLLGETSKAGDARLRGRHGEGLDLALLSGVRAGHEISVTTNTESWHPSLEYLDEFNGARCLVVNTRKLKKPRTDVTFSIAIDRDEWERLRPRFLFLSPPKDAITVAAGTLIMDEDRRGQIFVKGIYVNTSRDALGFGFDFSDVRLDRDRRVVDGFDLKWAAAQIVTAALNQDPERHVEPVLNLLEKESQDVSFIDSHLRPGTDASKALAKAFRQKYGDSAVPVQSMAESAQLEHLGVRGIVVPAPLAKVVGAEVGDYAVTAQKLRMQAKRLYSWDELSEVERANLTEVGRAFAGITEGGIDFVSWKLKVADFPDDSIEGKCHLGTGEMHVAKFVIGDYYRTMETIVHEVAHAISEAKDGTISHVRTIERLWRELYRAEREGRLQPIKGDA